jgi:hypothetical protein
MLGSNLDVLLTEERARYSNGTELTSVQFDRQLSSSALLQRQA